MQKHSKGKLVVAHSDMGRVKPTRAIWIKTGETECVLAVVQYPDTYTGSNGGAEREANAKVLAASFEMLGLLKETAGWLRNSPEPAPSLLASIDALIAKATGVTL